MSPSRSSTASLPPSPPPSARDIIPPVRCAVVAYAPCFSPMSSHESSLVILTRQLIVEWIYDKQRVVGVHRHAVHPLCPLQTQHVVPPCILLFVRLLSDASSSPSTTDVSPTSPCAIWPRHTLNHAPSCAPSSFFGRGGGDGSESLGRPFALSSSWTTCASDDVRPRRHAPSWRQLIAAYAQRVASVAGVYRQAQRWRRR